MRWREKREGVQCKMIREMPDLMSSRRDEVTSNEKEHAHFLSATSALEF